MKTKILTLGLICPLMLGCALSVEKKGHTIDYWRELFTEPFEVVYMIMKDGVTFKHSSQHKEIIDISISIMEEQLQKIKNKNYSIKEIAIVIHNHQIRKNFSFSDYKMYRMLKKYGFKGRFLLYCHRTDKAYDIEDNKKDLT